VVFRALGWSRSPHPIVRQPLPPDLDLERFAGIYHLGREGGRATCDTYLYRAPGRRSPLVELLAPPLVALSAPGRIDADFCDSGRELRARSRLGFFEPDWMERPIVEGDPFPLPVDPGARITALEASADGRAIHFTVDAPGEVSILVRAQYSRRWSASCEGRPLAVHRISPGFLLVVGKGEITLTHGPGLPEFLGFALTLAGLIAWCALALAALRRRRSHAA
jgi:hypothetical protein